MKAIRISQYGGFDALQLQDLALSEPGQGEVRVKIDAAGINYIDTYQRSGQYKPPLPFTLGQEAAGVVDALGAHVADLQIGDRVVYGSVLGAYAEYAIIPAMRAVKIPNDITAQQAAAVFIQGLTAHYLAHSTFALKPGDGALVHAAAGGVGLLLTQIAKLCGARVIATVSTQAKAQVARDAGADDVIIYTQADFEAEVMRLTNNQKLDVVYDSVGKTTFEKSLNCLKPRGMMVLYGQASGAVPPFDPQILNAKGSLFLTRPSLAPYTATRDELLARANDLFAWMLDGKLRVRIEKTFPLDQVADARRLLESRAVIGKLLLIP
ncbi:MAG: quinone oxidoreductase [Chloroflexi bacterium]|nr:quinone oxidoreductase [Chloroflexota bacterium]